MSISQLCRAGCDSIVIGIESYSDTALKRMSKSSSKCQNIKALETLKKYPLYTLHGFILFDNKTTLEELEENYQMLRKYSWPIMKGIGPLSI